MVLTLKIDARERKIKEFFKDIPYVKVSNLPLGDIIFQWNDEIILIIERKTINDLAHSIKDGRFREQKMRLMSNYPTSKIMYLIEGNLDLSMEIEIENALPVKTIYSSLYNMILRDNLHVYKTSGISETLRFIKNLVWKMETQDLSFMTSYTKQDYHVANMKMNLGKKKDMNKQTCFMYQLCQIKGVSLPIAEAITDKYPSWKELYDALTNCVNDLQRFELIGNLELPVKSKPSKSKKPKSTKPPKPTKTNNKEERKTRKVGQTLGCRIYAYMFT